MEDEGDHEVVRDVFGDSDEDEPASYRPLHEIDEDSHVRFKFFYFGPILVIKLKCFPSRLKNPSKTFNCFLIFIRITHTENFGSSSTDVLPMTLRSLTCGTGPTCQ